MPAFESRYIADYCAERFPEGGYQLRYPLGPIPREMVEKLGYDAAARLMRPWRPEIDAIKFWEDRLRLLETKVAKAWAVLGQLLLYKALVPYTEELRPWWNGPVEIRLIMPQITPIAREIAEAAGIVLEEYITPAVLEHAKKYNVYWTAEYQRARQEKLAIRKALGVE